MQFQVSLHFTFADHRQWRKEDTLDRLSNQVRVTHKYAKYARITQMAKYARITHMAMYARITQTSVTSRPPWRPGSRGSKR